MSKLKIGDIVTYCQGDHEAFQADHGRYPEQEEMARAQASRGTNGHRDHPAIVTAVWSEGCVNLQVFFDAKGVEVRTSASLLPEFPEGVHCTNSGWMHPVAAA